MQPATPLPVRRTEKSKPLMKNESFSPERRKTAGDSPAVLYDGHTSEQPELHRGHRERMRDRFRNGGASSFADHELLELLLFHALPRRNTNEIAHRLLFRFGSLRGVLGAAEEDLEQVEGIGPAGTLLLRLCGVLTQRAVRERVSAFDSFETLEQVGRYLTSYYYGIPNETVCLLLFDNGMRLLRHETVSEGAVNACNPLPRTMCRLAVQHNAAAVILAHNHPGGRALPSPSDVERTLEYEAAFGAVGIPLLEHLVVAGEDYAPILRHRRVGHRKAPLCNAFPQDFVKRFYMEGEQAIYDAP